MAKKPIIDTPAAERGRLKSDVPGEFHFEDTHDYVSFVAGALRRSTMKYSNVAKGGSMSSSTVSNLASGKTHYPRFSTITGILGALGYETVIRGGRR
jgi:hypothetical protein